MAIAGKFSDDTHIRILTISAEEKVPTDDSNDEAKISQLYYGVRDVGHIAINRETLCLFEIFFRLQLPLDKIGNSSPSQLVGFPRILFSSSISVNAP